jgi:hydrogenase maturation protease
MTLILVVGLGNTLMADDGAGVAVAARLCERPLPSWARAEASGTDALRLVSLWRGEAEVWLVDAIFRGAEPGTIHRLAHEEVLSIPQGHAGAHALSLPESLRLIAGTQPDMAAVRYRLWGIEPERVGPSPGLTPRVARAVEAVVEEIRSEFGRVGAKEVDDGGGRGDSIGGQRETEAEP